ncbi:helix-turn-helix domain-containing protein [Spirosoma sp. HMF4905]|uniref:Helix-turn-helix domain-containing protein n=1 Tax=Spirosoma arboris TaxID=2682092 RepID=A0A7K1SJW0_9BACT|nr:AraC family transcriptional regulator [Spirosoma arboris]MVM34101.1 helix-turn-helix domain-containing protein [Spirosoma arboris]
MKKEEPQPVVVQSVAQQHQVIGIRKPKHPLVSIFRFDEVPKAVIEQKVKFISHLYQITLKKGCPCKVKYGQTPYDFDEGIMSFFAPKQIQIIEPGDWQPQSGWALLIHPDFIRNFPLHQKIREYGYFGYELNEALILSEDEEKTIENILNQIKKEISLPIDNFSQDITIANLDLLLSYCNRYYNRQFIVRKPINNSLLQKAELILTTYFENSANVKGLPTTTFLASQLNLSPKYLSDCLKKQYGQTAQQFIHEKLIEYAKDILASTELSVNEIAYQLGFEFPQSFSKLFKSKAKQTPLEYRQSFN